MDARRGHGHYIQRVSFSCTCAAEKLLCFLGLFRGNGAAANAALLLKSHLRD